MIGTRREKIELIRQRMPDFYSWEELAKMEIGDLDFIINELYG